jgi:hypothetical protein
MFETPILFIVFNRPDTTLQVFTRIREVKPKRLFIAADGPRAGKEGEKEKCEKVRELILNGIDWNCEVHTLFREKNLGCGKAVSGGIGWFFEHVEEGIILEDDTLPNKSFFYFCQQLLDYYRHEEQIMHISGTSFLFKKRIWRNSYYFSIYPNIWGWATWSRAWQNYRFSLEEKFRHPEGYVNGTTMTKKELDYWKKCAEYVRLNPNSTWDYQWFFSIWQNSGICITPYVNMVTNIGFGLDSTHTKNADWKIANMPVFELLLPLIHPSRFLVKKKNDLTTFKIAHDIPTTLLNRLRNVSYKVLPYETRKKYLGF